MFFDRNVVVLGAGLSGLGFAREISSSKIYEAKTHPGGHAFSTEVEGVFFDEGAHISHTKNQRFVDLITKETDYALMSRCNVGNFDRGKWLGYPVQNHLVALPMGQRLKILKELIGAQFGRRGQSCKNYHEWCLDQYGETLTTAYYKRYTEKYWRRKMSELSIDWLKGRLLPSQLPRIVLNAFVHRRESQAVFSQFRYPKRGGFFSFFDPLYEGIDISFGHRAQQIDAKAKKIVFENGRTIDYEACASSLPLPALIGMIKNCPLAIREAAKKLAFTKLLCVNIVLSRPNMTDKHWFYVYDSDIDICRVSVPTNLCRNERSQQVTGLQAEIFRSGTESMAVAPLVEKAVLDMSRMMGFDAKKDVLALNHKFVPYAYIISDAQRQAAVGQVRSWLADQQISTMGLFGEWQFIWSDQAFLSGQMAAKTMLSDLLKSG